jgi:tetratricopeptide (TPR) repeat protein
LEYISPIVEQASQMIPSKVDHEYQEEFIYYLMARGHFFYKKEENITAREIYVQIDSMLGMEESLLHADVYYNLGLVNQRIYKDQSISRLYTQKAYNIYRKLNLKDYIIDTLIILALQYHSDELHEKALEVLKQAEDSAKESTNSGYLPLISYHYGRIYKGLKDYNNAIKYFEESLKLAKFLHQDVQKVYILRSLIEIHMEYKEWEKVNALMDESFKLLEIHEIPYIHVQLHGFKARICILRGDNYGYEKDMQKAIEIGLEKKQAPIVSELAKELGDYFFDNRAYKLSAKYFKISIENKLS